ncbi:MAG: hypothetical protein HYR88_13535 [Verrucomicrobia bacterium]|nr:hypothetical protein [Verrucomicrobiota bacterium]
MSYQDALELKAMDPPQGAKSVAVALSPVTPDCPRPLMALMNDPLPDALATPPYPPTPRVPPPITRAPRYNFTVFRLIVGSITDVSDPSEGL